MAYCILSKDGRQGNILHFLADAISDYAKIIDTCDPGSTIKVLDTVNPAGGQISDYMKSPSGKWVRISGEGPAIPENNVVISVFEGTKDIGGKKVSELQSDIIISEQGLVTGTSNYVTGYNKMFSKTPDGHFVAINIPKPEDAEKVDIVCGKDTKKVPSLDESGEYVIRLEDVDTQNVDGIVLNFKNGSDGVVGSCILDFSQVKRA